MCDITKKDQKAQLHISTNICLKFQARTPNGYGETVITRFSHNLGRKTNSPYLL